MTDQLDRDRLTEAMAVGGEIAVGWGRTLREFRRENGWSLATLAERIGSDAGTVSRIENARIGASDAMRVAIADAFGLDVDDIWSMPWGDQLTPYRRPKETAA